MHNIACCKIDGKEFPPYIIFKIKTVPRVIRFPTGLHAVIMVENVWKRRPGRLLRRP